MIKFKITLDTPRDSFETPLHTRTHCTSLLRLAPNDTSLKAYLLRPLSYLVGSFSFPSAKPPFPLVGQSVADVTTITALEAFDSSSGKNDNFTLIY